MKSLYKLEWLKWIKNPLNWIFGIGLPIVLLLSLGLSVSNVGLPDGSQVVNFIFPQVILLIVLTQTLTGLPINISAAREERQLKHYSMANITRQQYLLVQFLFNYTIYFIVFLICLILGISVLDIATTYQMILSVFFWPFLFYFCHFCLAMTITNFSKSFKTTTLISTILLYLLIIVSGIAFPYNLPRWVEYIKILTPTGSALIILKNCANGLNQGNNWTDWIVYLIFFLYFGGFTYLSFKYFKWY